MFIGSLVQLFIGIACWRWRPMAATIGGLGISKYQPHPVRQTGKAFHFFRRNTRNTV